MTTLSFDFYIKNFSFIILLALFSCKNINEDNINSINLQGDIINLDDSRENICKPKKVLNFNKYLVLVNRVECEYRFTIVDKTNFKIINHSLKHGNGPEEYSGVWAVVKSKNLSNHIEFFDLFKLGCYRINIENMVNQKNPRVTKLAQFKQVGDWSNIEKNNGKEYFKPNAAYYINENLFITTDYFEQGVIGLADSTGNLLNTYFSYPDDEKVNVKNQLKHTIFQFKFNAHPIKDIFVNVFNNSDWFIIYTLKNEKLELIHNQFTYLPAYKNLSGGPVISLKESGNHELGNVDLEVSNNYIYILRSKLKLKDAIKGYKQDSSSPYVYVYNWKGDNITRLILDYKVTSISVANNDEFMYAISETDDYELIKYQLPRIF
mgnify:CR=1 FL=1